MASEIFFTSLLSSNVQTRPSVVGNNAEQLPTTHLFPTAPVELPVLLARNTCEEQILTPQGELEASKQRQRAHLPVEIFRNVGQSMPVRELKIQSGCLVDLVSVAGADFPFEP